MCSISHISIPKISVNPPRLVVPVHLSVQILNEKKRAGEWGWVASLEFRAGDPMVLEYLVSGTIVCAGTYGCLGHNCAKCRDQY